MSKNPIIAACPYCGQISVETEEKAFKNQKEADNWAVTNCKCYEATKIVNKNKTLGRAREEIDKMFGGSDGTDRRPARDLLMLAATLIVDGEIETVNVSLSNGTKAKVATGTKNALSITRTDTQATKQEV